MLERFTHMPAMHDSQTKSERAPQSKQASPTSAPDFRSVFQTPYARTLFFGAQGLRPGWGFSFYVLAFWFLRRAADSWLVDWVHLSRMSTRALEIIFEGAWFLAAALPALALGRIEKRPWNSYGLPVRGAFGKAFWVGAAWGFAGISLLILPLYGLHDFTFGRIVLHGARVAKFAAYWAFLFLLVGLFEEFLFRGYPQFTLARGVGFWPAAIALSTSFGLTHLWNEGERWTGALAAAFIALFFCLTLRRTGSLWFAVGFHAAWDWGESFFYSVPDSGLPAPGHLLNSSLHGSVWFTGGSVGPEGSILCFAVIALVWIAFDRVYSK